MEVIFVNLLNMSLTAVWPILASLLLRIFLKRAPKWSSCVLWGIAALRLICPFALNSPLSLIPSAKVLDIHAVQYAPNPTIHTGVPVLDRTLNPAISEAFAPSPGASVNPLYVWIFIAGMIWAVGAVLMLCYALFHYLRLKSMVREALPLFPMNDGRSGTNKNATVWLCDAVSSPFILGFIKPRIYLPSGIEEEVLPYVVTHEEAHLQRKDHLWKLLGYFLLAVHWFNPLVWAAYFVFCRDMELSCDEKIIRDYDLTGKKAYANALVSCGIQRKVVLICPPAFGAIDVKKRVDAVLKYKKPEIQLVVTAVVLCAAAAVCFLTNPPVSKITEAVPEMTVSYAARSPNTHPARSCPYEPHTRCPRFLLHSPPCSRSAADPLRPFLR